MAQTQHVAQTQQVAQTEQVAHAQQVAQRYQGSQTEQVAQTQHMAHTQQVAQTEQVAQTQQGSGVIAQICLVNIVDWDTASGSSSSDKPDEDLVIAEAVPSSQGVEAVDAQTAAGNREVASCASG